MKAELQSRTRIQHRVFLVASLLALSVCLVERPVALAADEAKSAAAKESSEKKDKPADADSKKDKSESPTSKSTKSTDGKSDQKDSAKPATSSTESKSKTTATKQAAEKSTKGEKVRLAMLTLKDSLPETSEQAGPFGEIMLDIINSNLRVVRCEPSQFCR